MNIIEVRNDLTKKFDEHLVDELKKIIEEGYCKGTYIFYTERDYQDKSLAIRFPGATRGGIFIDSDDIITRIELITETCFDHHCYKESLKSIIPELLGTQLDLSSVRNHKKG